MANTKKPVRQRVVVDFKASVPTRERKKGAPRGKPFVKGNEKAWKPGQSGNPAGRPKGTGEVLISKAYRARSEERVPDELFDVPEFAHLKKFCKGITWAELVALGQLRSAAGGNTMAAKEIREAVEGKDVDRQQQIGADGQPVDPAQPVAVNVNFVKPKKAK